jgi:serine/threonine protein phosphatase 1
MATYVISDIHGNLEVFKKLLKEINFKFNGEDKLYILGDYVDWGPKPLETLLYVMELSKEHSFIYPLLGNHDLMFLDQIKAIKESEFNYDYNWLHYNGGQQTFNEYQSLSNELKEEVENFLENLPYRAEIIVNNKRYIMAHACPVDEFVYDEKMSKEENEAELYHKKSRATWNRITRKVMNVTAWYSNYEDEYENFICGHTITENIKDGHYSIINREKNSISIDCGAKVLGHKDFDEEEYACLAALRLDDMKEFYTR